MMRKAYPRPLIAGMAASSLAYVVLCMHLPLTLLADAGFDDFLFVQHGMSIISGQWLGPYSQMTLAKGPGYPLFLAASAVLGLPISLSQALLYAGACLLMADALFRLTRSAWLAFFCLLAIQWHPALFPIRVIRDDLSAPQVLIILAALCHCALLPGRLPSRLLWAALGGLALGWFWLTREDAIWIVPGLVLIVALQALRLRRQSRAALRLGAAAAAMALSASATLTAVAAINLWVYGTFVTVDFKSASFEKALDILQTVRAGPPVPFVPVPAPARAAIARVSPAFASLQPYFNGVGRSWTAPGCATYPTTCGDYAGGWFMWALRDAVAATGHYRSPQAAARFYRTLWQQVHAACQSGKLSCKPNALPFMPATTAAQWRRWPAELFMMARLATWVPQVAIWDFNHRFPDSTGDFTRLHQMEDFLRHPRRTRTASEQGSVTVDGWFHAPNASWIRLRCQSKEGELVLPITRLKSPDLVVFFHSAAAGADRFSITVPHLRGCALQAKDAAGQTVRQDLTTLPPGITPFAGGSLGIDAVRQSGRAGQLGIRLLAALNRLYAWVMAPLAALGAIFLLAALTWRAASRARGFLDGPLILVLGIWGLLAARAAVLILVDISSFPAIGPLYWAAGFPLLCLASLLALVLPFARRLPPLPRSPVPEEVRKAEAKPETEAISAS